MFYLFKFEQFLKEVDFNFKLYLVVVFFVYCEHETNSVLFSVDFVAFDRFL